jgi:hypothetical protein
VSDWWATARVRAGVAPAELGEGAWFSAQLAPHVDAPEVVALGPEVRSELLRAAAGRYLHATVVLETGWVNPVAQSIAEGHKGFVFPDAARIEARKLYCDEAYHALLAHDLGARIGQDAVLVPSFAERRRLATSELRGRDLDVARLLFVFTTETVLSASLSTLARDPTLVPAIRAFAEDHLRDEAWHARFFGDRFAELWDQLLPHERDAYGPWIPRMIVDYLLPDQSGAERDLRRVGVEVDAVRIASTTYRHEAVLAPIVEAARSTVAHVRRAGAMVGATKAAFESYGFLS